MEPTLYYKQPSQKMGLMIFKDFRTDYTLPKFKKDEPVQEGSSQSIFFSSEINTSPAWAVNNTDNKEDKHVPGLATCIRIWLTSLRDFFREKRKKAPEVVFDQAHVALQQLENSAGVPMRLRLALFDEHVEQAKKMGQVGLCERLAQLRKRAVAELAMVQEGVGNKYLTEEQAVLLISECKKGLTLDWIANFGRTIPKAVCEAKTKADAVKVFDNYVVMHFDPGHMNFTPPRDPILFGVMAGSPRLYFVADWTDEVCSFTLKEAEELLDGKSEKLAVTGTKLEES